MKKLILLSIFTFSLSTLANAQNAIAFFQVENENYVLLNEFAPQAEIEYYSQTSGGHRMGIEQLDDAGNHLQAFPTDNTPAFVLYRNSAHNPKGTNKVLFLHDKEFVAKDIKAKVLANQIQINWNAQVFDGNEITFQLIKQIAGKEELIKTVEGVVSASSVAYSFQVTYDAQATYTLQIVKNKNKLRYATSLVLSDKIEIAVYPTMCQSTLNVDISMLANDSEYFISNSIGQIVKQGVLLTEHNMLDVQSLSNACYVLQVKNGNLVKSIKFVKE